MTDPSRNPRTGHGSTPTPTPTPIPSPNPAPASQSAPGAGSSAPTATPAPSPYAGSGAGRSAHAGSRGPASSTVRAVAAVETKPLPRNAAPVVARDPEAPLPARPSAAVTVPRVWVYWGITGFVLLFILIWWGGVNAGKQDAERRFAQQIAPQVPGPSGETPASDDPSPDSGETRPPEPDQTLPAPPAPTGPIYHAGAWVAADPRIKGMNYLHLVVLPRPDAVRAIDYLRSKGRQAVAVPSKVVDRSPDGGKNPSYFVYLLTPLSKDQYRDAATRQRVENDVKALGKEWAKSKDRGPSDFSQPGWVKYDE